MSANTFEFSNVVLPKLLSMRKKSRDPRDIRLAAVTSAIVDTAKERKKLQNNPIQKASEKVTASELFAVTLTALEGTIMNDENSNTNGNDDTSPQFQLLQILQNTIPHVPSSFFMSQFNLLSRLLRGITMATKGAGLIADMDMDYNDTNMKKNKGKNMETKDELGGQNAKLRQIIKTSKQALYYFIENKDDNVIAGSDKDKAIIKLLDGTLMDLFHDKRPKVRKLAHTSVLELVADDDDVGYDTNMTSVSSSSMLIRTHIGEYVLAVLSHYGAKQKKKANSENIDGDSDKFVKMMHLMQFCEGVCKYLPMKYKICDDALKLVISILMSINQHESGPTGIKIKMNQIHRDNEGKRMLVTALLNVLIAVVEDGQNSMDIMMDMDMEDEHDSESSKRKELAGKILASLIQLSSATKQNVVSNSTNASINEALEECNMRQAQLLVSCCVTLRNTNPGMKLLPIALTMVLNYCDSNVSSATCIQSCSSEVQRMIRSCFDFSKDADETAQKQCAQSGSDCILKLLHHRFRPYWDFILPAYSSFVTQLGKDEKFQDILKTMLQNLVDAHENVNDETSSKAIESTCGSIIQGIGLEIFWDLVPLDGTNTQNDENNKALSKTCIGQDRAWLIPLLITHSRAPSSIRPHLGFFQMKILSLARKCDALSGDSKLSALEISVAKSQCIDMWKLLLGFCGNNPIDIVESFPRLAQTFVKAIMDKRYPQLISIISTGLKELSTATYDRAQQNPDDKSIQADIKTLSKMSEKILPTLFKLVDLLSKSIPMTSKSSDAMDVEESKDNSTKESAPQDTAQKIHHITLAIQSLAKITSAAFLQTIFQKLLTRLLKASTEPEQNMNQIASLLNLAQALVSSAVLESDSISLLYRTIKPLIRTDEFSPNIQKRAYKVMSSLCQNYTQFIIGEKLDEVIELMLGSLMTCQVASRSVRLQCLQYVVDGLDFKSKKQMDVIPQIMGEVLLCLKDSNTKTREAAYQLLLSMSRLHKNQNQSLQEFFTIILGALGGQTPQMRSAAVMALSRLVFEYARDEQGIQELLPSLLQTIMVLFDENSREVIKSVIGFVRISVAALKPMQLEPLLPELLEGLFKYDKGRGRFRSKIKIILKKLVKIYGYEKLSPLVPESRLVNHMRKMDERAKRRKEALKAQGLEAEDDFEGMMDSDEDDSDDGRTLMTGVTGFTRMTAKSGKTLRTAAIEKSVAMSRGTKTMASKSTKATTKLGMDVSNGPRIQKEKNGEIFDLLDPRMSKHVHFQDTNDGDSDFDDDDNSGVMEFDEKGRLVVHDDDYQANADLDANDDEDDDIENSQIKRGVKRMKLSKFEDAKLARNKSNATKSKKKKNNVKALGSAYKSKKSGGDVKRKGQKFEPYAYVPLDGKSYTKKNRGLAVNQMETVVKSGKRKNRS